MSEHNIPNGWIRAKISDISIKGLQRKPAVDERFTYVDIGSIDRSLKKISDPQVIAGGNAPSRARKVIESGNVLVSLTRPNLNAVALVDQKYHNQIASTGFEVIKPVLVDSRYIFTLVRSKEFVDQISGVVQGALYPAAKSSDVQNFEFPLPPLTEQKVIADKLDTLLAQVENTKARLERIPQILKRFRQSALAAAVSGRLTEEWRRIHSPLENTGQLLSRWEKTRYERFEEAQDKLLQSGKIKKFRKFKKPSNPDLDTAPPPDIPDSWKLVSVSQLAECLDHMRIPVKKDDRATAKGLYPYFGANGEVDKVDEYIFDGDFVLVTEDETFYGREKPIAYRYSGKCWVNNHAHILQAPTRLANDYLCYSLMHYNVIPWLSGTTGRAKLTQAALNSLPIGLPPENELNEIVHRVDQLFAHADCIEQQVKNALARVNNLAQSILAKAFRGELTEQWRKDNPELISGENSAQALMERIKVERAAMKPAKKTRQKRTTA
ncbi:MAG TPA: type I restriction endonuclease subunit S [Halomonas campaniensis]|uniref:Type I restriction endonuclease subunit S n=1 Tax=Halomonas campaniensis TaxID=213554 RepID=A0A3D0KD98_9GAMM|nr:restriction endonuclease subunit S [Halomonas sp. 3F2F]HCA01493.1 type I restriction endonuclease subunit S [Halomonas campaniensis]